MTEKDSSIFCSRTLVVKVQIKDKFIDVCPSKSVWSMNDSSVIPVGCNLVEIVSVFLLVNKEIRMNVASIQFFNEHCS